MNESPPVDAAPPWMRTTLWLAGWYNLTLGTLGIWLPTSLFEATGADAPRYPVLWQCIGIVVVLFGLGYFVASRRPYVHWGVVLLGLSAKVCVPLTFAWAAWSGQLPWAFALLIALADVVWWAPLTIILLGAVRFHADVRREDPPMPLSEVMKTFVSHRGYTLARLAEHGPVLVVFVRHSGCTFCREALDKLSMQKPMIEAQGVTLAVVHMSELMGGTELLGEYDLGDVHRFSDPSCALYRAFGLSRGTYQQLLGPSVLWRGLVAFFVKGHGAGPVVGDSFQLPGAFVIQDDRVLAEFRAAHAADNPDYLELVAEGVGAPIGAP